MRGFVGLGFLQTFIGDQATAGRINLALRKGVESGRFIQVRRGRRGRQASAAAN